MGGGYTLARQLASIAIYILPVIVLATGLLMVSGIRYQHIVNRYLRGKRSLARLLAVLVLLLLLIVWHQYTLALGMLIYAMLGPVTWAYLKWRPRPATTP